MCLGLYYSCSCMIFLCVNFLVFLTTTFRSSDMFVAQWLGNWTRDQKVTSSSPSWLAIE